MLSVEEYTATNSNATIVGENSTHLETSINTVLALENIETQSKTAPDCTEQCENIMETSESLNSTLLDTKDLVYDVSVTTDSSAILSLSPNDGPIVPAISENNFESTENSLLDGFRLETSHKDELTAENVCSTSSDTQIDDAVGQSEDLMPQDLGDLPPWAVRLKGCERIGDSYRGYVHTEAELDILLSMHKEYTNSSWGTRQSPSSQKPSVRFMWKSQYIPYDGIPFLNSGRRATVMECQYGPRRKGNKVKVEYNENGHPVKRAHRPTCPARIYIKRVRKFPEYKIDKKFDGTPGLRLAQERALTALRVACLESRGEERFYIQFPLEIAHEYHHDDDEMIPHQTLTLLPTQVNLGSSRLDSRVVEMINDLVARGVTDIYQVKHGVINYVEKDLFLGRDEEPPARHNKLFYPTITDIQNHIHQAQLALESGTLESLPPPETPPKSLEKDDRSRKRKRAEPRRVRGSKSTPLRTICIRTNDQLELTRDHSIQDAQGQVYVMVPSSGSSLFANSESLVGASLHGEKTTSLPLVQVVTVPASCSSAFVGQQVVEQPSLRNYLSRRYLYWQPPRKMGNGTLDLTGQFLALPVVNCDNPDQISTSENSAMLVQSQDSFGKEPISVIPLSAMESSLNEKHVQHHITEDHIQTANNQLPLSTVALSIPPATITMTTPGLHLSTTNTTVNSIETVEPLKTNNVIPNQNMTTVESTMARSTNNAVMTSSNLSMTSMVPITSPDILMTSSRLNVNSLVQNTSSNMPDLSMSYTPVNSSGVPMAHTPMSSDALATYTPATSSAAMPSSSSAVPMTYTPVTSSKILMTSLASSTVPMPSLDILTSQEFTMSYSPMTSSSTLMTSPYNPMSSKTLDNFANIQPSTATIANTVAQGNTNRSPLTVNNETAPGINELFDEMRKTSKDQTLDINSSPCRAQSYHTSVESMKSHTTSPLDLSEPNLNATYDR